MRGPHFELIFGRSGIKEAGISEEIESYEPADLNRPLELFF